MSTPFIIVWARVTSLVLDRFIGARSLCFEAVVVEGGKVTTQLFPAMEGMQVLLDSLDPLCVLVPLVFDKAPLDVVPYSGGLARATDGCAPGDVSSDGWAGLLLWNRGLLRLAGPRRRDRLLGASVGGPLLGSDGDDGNFTKDCWFRLFGDDVFVSIAHWLVVRVNVDRPFLHCALVIFFVRSPKRVVEAPWVSLATLVGSTVAIGAATDMWLSMRVGANLQLLAVFIALRFFTPGFDFTVTARMGMGAGPALQLYFVFARGWFACVPGQVPVDVPVVTSFFVPCSTRLIAVSVLKNSLAVAADIEGVAEDAAGQGCFAIRWYMKGA